MTNLINSKKYTAHRKTTKIMHKNRKLLINQLKKWPREIQS